MVSALPQRSKQNSKANGQPSTGAQWIITVNLGLKPTVWKQQTPQHLGRTHNHMKEMQFSSIKMPLTMEIIPELPCVGEGLDHTVHKTSISQIDQSSEARETHFLLLHFFSSLTACRRSVSHGLHHAGGLGLWTDKRISHK